MADKCIGKFTLNDLVGAVEIVPKNLGSVVLLNGRDLRLKKSIKGKIFRKGAIPYVVIDKYPDRTRHFYSDRENGSLQDLFEAISQELHFTYGEYGFVKDSRLSRNAIMLKKWINEYITRVSLSCVR